MLKSFRDLEVWQKAHAFVLEVYRASAQFPQIEKYGITSQLRRAAMSVPANIAEGFGRKGTKEFLQCLAISNGSLEEARYFLLLSQEFGYLPAEWYKKLELRCDSIGAMIGALSRSLRERSEGVSRVAGRGPRVATPISAAAGAKG
jgi:four helix bundle protein